MRFQFPTVVLDRTVNQINRLPRINGVKGKLRGVTHRCVDDIYVAAVLDEGGELLRDRDAGK